MFALRLHVIAGGQRELGTQGDEALVKYENGRDVPGHDAGFVLLQSQPLFALSQGPQP
jgi:hypothetical protein